MRGAIGGPWGTVGNPGGKGGLGVTKGGWVSGGVLGVLGKIQGSWVVPLGDLRVPLLPRSSLGGPRVYWGALGDPLERDGDFAKSLIWVYECVHLGRRRGPCGTSEGREVERILRPDA